jgi:hypothetical protein
LHHMKVIASPLCRAPFAPVAAEHMPGLRRIAEGLLEEMAAGARGAI